LAAEPSARRLFLGSEAVAELALAVVDLPEAVVELPGSVVELPEAGVDLSSAEVELFEAVVVEPVIRDSAPKLPATST
jgi:hypothetical protein